MKIAICPGSFDPVTNGHLDIFKRASKIFDKVIVAVMVNSKKKAMFSVEERCTFLRKSTKDISNIEVMASDGLLAGWVDSVGDCVLVKGIRAVSDFESEFQMALINRNINAELETLFLPTSEKFMFLSSSVVKEVCSLGGDISSYVPSVILKDVQNRILRGE